MDEETEQRIDRRIDQLQRVYEDHGRVFKITWVAVAVVIVLTGVAMVIVPGPSTIVIPAGLTMLAGVFGWARRAVKASVEGGIQIKSRMEEASWVVRVLGFVASGCVAAAAVALPLLW